MGERKIGKIEYVAIIKVNALKIGESVGSLKYQICFQLFFIYAKLVHQKT